jgi:hypothetical protein
MTLLIKSTHPFGQTLVKDVVRYLVKLQCLRNTFGTFVSFSTFHLNTSKLANIKVVHLSKGHTFHNWRNLRFWVEIGEKLSQLQLLLFTSAMKDSNFACSLCPNHWSTHRPTFVKVVEGSFINNFALCTLVHLSSKFWRFSLSNRGKWNRRGDISPAWTRGVPPSLASGSLATPVAPVEACLPRPHAPRHSYLEARALAMRRPRHARPRQPRLHRPPATRRAHLTMAGSPLFPLLCFLVKACSHP